MTVYSQAAYCPCGAEIWLEWIGGSDGWRCLFFDDRRGEITHCPQCGRRLDEDELESL